MTQLHNRLYSERMFRSLDECEPTSDKSRQTKVRAGLGSLACGLAGATLGIGLALNGAHYTTEIADIPAEVTTSISTQRHIRIGGEVVDPNAPPTDLGGVEFRDVTKLPLAIDVSVRADAELVEALLTGDLSQHVHDVKGDVTRAADDAVKFFQTRALVGGLAGAAAAELGLMTASRLQRRSSSPTALEIAGRSTRATSAWLAATALVGGGLAVSYEEQALADSYHVFGWSAEALRLPDQALTNTYKGTALDKILYDFELLHACPESTLPPKQSPEDVIVTSYNIKRGSVAGIEQIAAELRASGSDIITLQEVTGETLEQLSQLLGMESTHGWTIEGDTLTYGNAILTNLPITQSRVHTLPSEGVEPRQLLVSTVMLPGGEKAVIATMHLSNSLYDMNGDDTREVVRTEQAEEVNRILDQRYYATKPVVLTGDLNATFTSTTYEALADSFTDAADATDTLLHATNPSTGRRLDYIYTKPAERNTTHSLTVSTGAVGGGQSSDHCSVSAALSAVPGN